MRSLLQLFTGALLVSLTFLSQPAEAQTSSTTRSAQVVTPPAKEPGPQPGARQLQQVAPPSQIDQKPSVPSGATRPTPQLKAKSTIPSLEQENKNLKDRIAQQDLVILNLTGRLDQSEKTGALAAARAKQLGDQIDAMTKRGGSLVRAFCENESVSRNTAGAVNNCASLGYACEQVSGVCYSRCSKTDQCARGWVCDPPVATCIRP
jgi:hypothetical protein